jgi:hypothetical protein
VNVGTPAAVPDRPVVGKTLASGLTVICRGVAVHDACQGDPIHWALVTRFQSDWKRVQIYDAA